MASNVLNHGGVVDINTHLYRMALTASAIKPLRGGGRVASASFAASITFAGGALRADARIATIGAFVNDVMDMDAPEGKAVYDVSHVKGFSHPRLFVESATNRQAFKTLTVARANGLPLWRTPANRFSASALGLPYALVCVASLKVVRVKVGAQNGEDAGEIITLSAGESLLGRSEVISASVAEEDESSSAIMAELMAMLPIA